MKNTTDRKIHKIEISILAGLIIAAVLSFTTFASTCQEIRTDVLRMHVIANSDGDEDQILKLKVRDAVLKEGKEIFDGSLTASQAEEILNPQKDRLLAAAQKEIADNGYDYDVKIEISKDFFSTRIYDDRITLPAGEYEAVRVIIGEGKGKNWWCVMFPPMCLPAAEGGDDVSLSELLTDDELEIVESKPKYEPRFKIIELYEKLVDKLK